MSFPTAIGLAICVPNIDKSCWIYGGEEETLWHLLFLYNVAKALRFDLEFGKQWVTSATRSDLENSEALMACNRLVRKRLGSDEQSQI